MKRLMSMTLEGLFYWKPSFIAIHQHILTTRHDYSILKEFYRNLIPDCMSNGHSLTYLSKWSTYQNGKKL